MSATTFACPHCAAIYPLKPVLIGRAVRCTTCRNPFRLRPDGVADKVVEVAPGATTRSGIISASGLHAVSSAQKTGSGVHKAGSGLHQAPPAATLAIPANADAMTDAPAAGKDDDDWLTKEAPEKQPSSRIVRRSGVLKVPVPAAPPPPAPPETPKPAAEAPKPDAEAPKPIAEPEAASDSNRTAPRSSRIDRKKPSVDEEQRRNIAASLNTSLDAAVKAESAKDPKPSTGRTAKGGDRPTKTVGKTATSTKAVVTGSGEAAAKRRMHYLLAGIGAAAILILILVLRVDRSPQRKALDAFISDPPPDELKTHGTRGRAVIARAWLASGPPVEAYFDLGTVTRETPTFFNLRPETFDALRGKVRLAKTRLWVKPEDATAALKAIPVLISDHQLHLRRAAAKKIAVADAQVIIDDLIKNDMPMLADMLLHPANPGVPSLTGLLAAGGTITGFETQVITGANATLLHGPDDDAQPGVAWIGLLMRIPELDEHWRVYEIVRKERSTNRKDEFEVPTSSEIPEDLAVETPSATSAAGTAASSTTATSPDPIAPSATAPTAPEKAPSPMPAVESATASTPS